jgi:hypothetical protein
MGLYKTLNTGPHLIYADVTIAQRVDWHRSIPRSILFAVVSIDFLFCVKCSAKFCMCAGRLTLVFDNDIL